ncbi:MAG: NADH-quinone oxidoreductase subunit L, partial [Desulfuromonas sp.]
MKENLLFLIPLLPLAGAAVNMVLGTRLPRRLAVAIYVSSVAAATLLTMLLWPLCGGEGTRATLYAWLESGSFRAPVEILFDPLSAPMALMVTSVSTLIHIYASGYMKEERD